MHYREEVISMNEQMEEYVMVAVPKKYVPQVYGLIAAGEDALPEAPVTQVPQKNADLESDGPEDLLKRQYDESPESIKLLQKHLAAHAGQGFTRKELEPVMGFDGSEWRSFGGALGAYGNRVKNRYNRSTWPLDLTQSPETGKWLYSMPPDKAAIISTL
jgi:hypothetical protein